MVAHPEIRSSQSPHVVGKIPTMPTRKRHTTTRMKKKKKSKLRVILLMLSAAIVFVLMLSVTAFYSGRYEILDRFSPPKPADD